MMLRLAPLALFLALPLAAQAPEAANAAENTFYKAFYLEKGERDFAGAMALYEKFLANHADHKYARAAAENQLALLQRTGKTKDADAFAQKYSRLLGNAAVATAGDGDRPAAGDGPRPGRGEGARGRGEGARGGDAAGQAVPRGNMEERLKELEAQLAKAKEEGDAAAVERLERQIQRTKAMAERGGAGRGEAGGPEGARGGRGGFGGRGFGQVKFADMSEEQLAEFKTTRLDMMSRMIDMLRENGQDERAKAIEDGVAAVKKALDENKLEDAQKAYDKMVEGMRGRGR